MTHLNQVHVAIDATGFTVHKVFQVLAFVGVWSGVERYSHQRKQNLTQILFFFTFLTFPLFIWESSTGAPVKWGAAGLLTVEKAVVLEAASAEQRVEGVQALLTLHRASVGPVDVGRALGGQRTRQLLLRQLFISDTQNTESRHTRRN